MTQKQDMLQYLTATFGYSEFRDNQEMIIENILEGNDVIAVMPTGGGKSLCFQYPAGYFYEHGKGTTIVISPLVALMEDQLRSLESTGIPAAMISHSICTDRNVPDIIATDRQTVMQRALDGQYALLYLSPENLVTQYFANKSRKMTICLVVVDEAHCLSQWGFQFRESYLRIPQFIDNLEKRPQIAAFTATLSIQGQEDIKRMLKMKTGNTSGDKTFMLPEKKIRYERDNLNIKIQKIEEPDDEEENTKTEKEKKKEARDNKCQAILDFISASEQSTKDGIIYFNTIKDLNAMAKFLKKKNSKAKYKGDVCTFYSTPQPGESVVDRHKENKRSLEIFTQKEKRNSPGGMVMLATTAFGMGIDKKDIGYVVHFDPPMDIETYYQEIGRAGRDNDTSCPCLLFYTPEDYEILDNSIKPWENPEDTIYPYVTSHTAAANLEISMLQTCKNNVRARSMESFLTASNSLKGFNPMKWISDYFRGLHKKEELHEFDEFRKAILDMLDLDNDDNKNHMEGYLYNWNYTNKEESFFESIQAFRDMLEEDMGKDLPRLQTWEYSMAEKFSEFLHEREWLYCNDTKLAKNIRKGGYAKDKWSKIRLNRKKVEEESENGSDTQIVITRYLIESSNKKTRLTWFDMLVADAVYTLWAQGERHFSVNDIIDRITGNTEGNGSYDKNASIFKEITESLDRMSKDIKIGFPVDDMGDPIFMFNEGNDNEFKYQTKKEREEKSILRPFLPLCTNGNGSYIIKETPLLCQYAEYQKEIFAIPANELCTPCDFAYDFEEPLRKDFYTIKIQAYIVMRANIYHKILRIPNKRSKKGSSDMIEGSRRIRLFRGTDEETSKAEFMNELLQLDVSSEEDRDKLIQTVLQIMRYERYIGTDYMPGIDESRFEMGRYQALID